VHAFTVSTAFCSLLKCLIFHEHKIDVGIKELQCLLKEHFCIIMSHLNLYPAFKITFICLDWLTNNLLSTPCVYFVNLHMVDCFSYHSCIFKPTNSEYISNPKINILPYFLWICMKIVANS
jgi:hypothetical protein